KKNKILITTLTKRMAEDLTDYMRELGIRVKYLHSDIDTLERTEITKAEILPKLLSGNLECKHNAGGCIHG
ncbi:MAG: hypothetical protein II247_05470, partial [Lachnospiraceae bacterium]|nr:hypothetical protein [Lachnospiraceae bacterium]